MRCGVMIVFLQLGLQEFQQDLDTRVPAHNHYCKYSSSKFDQQNMTFLVQMYHFWYQFPTTEGSGEVGFKILLSSTYCHPVIKLHLIWLSTLQHKTLARITASVTIHIHCIFFHWASFLSVPQNKVHHTCLETHGSEFIMTLFLGELSL